MTDLGPVLAGVLLAMLLVGLWLLWTAHRDLRELRGGTAPLVEGIQRQIEAVRAEDRAGQDALRGEVGALSARVQVDLLALRAAVAVEVQGLGREVGREIQDGMRLIHDAHATVGERLDRAARVVGEVQGSLGRLGEATQRVVEVGRDLQGLEQVLRSPKMRGGLGETLLGELLGQMLPREHYAMQHGFRTGDRVDAVVRIGERVVPVDAKFPLENFRRLLAEPEEERRRPFRRAFARDVKARVDEIAKKYILPDEGTFDFALMYVPAENVYYEIVVRGEEAEDEPVATYALSRRVIPVSPNSLFAYLQVIVLGLRGLEIESNARDIQNDLMRLGGDLVRVRDHMGKLGSHLVHAQKQFDDAQRDLARFEAKLEEVERKGDRTALPDARP
ncbi:MAG TPA: DNA recombination protein RmuC [Candidatus Binatia bacterium]|nr:DNA recombination protein RmuC [Candidatus Binatia bacterium]